MILYKILAQLKTRDNKSELLKFLTDKKEIHQNNLLKMRLSNLINVYYEGVTTDNQDLNEYYKITLKGGYK